MKVSRLLQEILGHLNAGTTAEAQKTVAKLAWIAALSKTLVLSI